MRRLWLILLAIALVGFVACSDDGEGAQPPTDPGPVMEPDPTPDPEPVPVPDPEPEPEPEPGPELPPLMAFDELEPVPAVQWVVGFVVSGEDPVREALEQGTFEIPEPGRDENGILWQAVTPGEDGQLVGSPFGLVYAAAIVDVGSSGVVARLDRVLNAYVNGVWQSGDLYGSGRMRVPLPVREGENLIVLRALTGRGAPSVALFETDDEIVFNLADLTTPHLRVGDEGEQFVGAPVLTTGRSALVDVKAQVVASPHFEATELSLPALAGAALTKVPFHLKPRFGFEPSEAPVVARLRVESPDLARPYERDIELSVVEPNVPFKRAFRSKIDGSAQYYGVVPPVDYDPSASYGTVLTLHGAGVEGIGQARAYSAKEDAFVVAPTNRRPFGFDWEVWGRLDGLEVLDHAMESWDLDPTRVYLTGHSMGGHGTWQLGVLFPGRFAVIGPSAGWSSFYSYTGRRRPGGAFARSQASSETNNYVSNLAERAVYVIHGSADDNVPVREGRDMVALVTGISDDVSYHEQPGAGHWWDGDRSPGADCVDWPPLFEKMREHRLDPFELDFTFTSPGPWVSPNHSFVSLRSALTSEEDCVVTSSAEGDTVEITTSNVRSMILDGESLAMRGVSSVVVDGVEVEVVAEDMPVGPQTGKRPGVHGPVAEVFYRPFCFVTPDEGPEAYAAFASVLISDWAMIGNGLACALPISRLSDEIRAERNLIYLGVDAEQIEGLGDWPITWDEAGAGLGETRFEGAAVVFTFPRGDRLDAVMATPEGSEHLLMGIRPFTSAFVLPDYLVWSDEGGQAAGFYDADWGL